MEQKINGEFLQISPDILTAKDKDVDWWLFGHETGHMFTSGDWMFLGETSANFFAMYTLKSEQSGMGRRQ